MTDRLSTTLRLLCEYGMCYVSYANLADALGGEEAWGLDSPVSLARVMELSGYDDAVWALRAVPPEQAALRDRVLRLHVVDCICAMYLVDGRTVWDLLTTPESRTAVDAARRYAMGEATAEELLEARTAAERLASDVPEDAEGMAALAAVEVAGTRPLAAAASACAVAQLMVPQQDSAMAYTAARMWQAANLMIWLLRGETITSRESRECRWSENWEGIWTSGCDHTLVALDAPPSDCDMRFCPRCGLRLVEAPYAATGADEDERETA